MSNKDWLKLYKNSTKKELLGYLIKLEGAYKDLQKRVIL